MKGSNQPNLSEIRSNGRFDESTWDPSSKASSCLRTSKTISDSNFFVRPEPNGSLPLKSVSQDVQKKWVSLTSFHLFVTTWLVVLSILARFPYLLSPLYSIMVMWLVGVVVLVSREFLSESDVFRMKFGPFIHVLWLLVFCASSFLYRVLEGLVAIA